MFLARLAVLNLFRNRRRTVLSMAAVIAGVAVWILGRGFVGGITENIIRAQIDSASGHVVARPTDYPTAGMRHPIDALVTVDADDAAWLDANSQAWTKRVIFTPQAIAGPDSLRVRAIAYDPARDEAVFPRGTWQVQGEVPASAGDGVLVSKGLASLLSLEVGDRLVLQARTTGGAINALDVPVGGLVTTANPMFDRLGLFLPMDLAESLIRHEGRASHVAVRLDRRAAAAGLAPGIAAQLGAQAEVATWEEESHDLVELQKIREKALNFLVLALLGMSATGIANTVLMAAYERVREVGTMQAMGMTRGGVVRLFLMEGALLGIIGSVLGAGLGGGVVAWYQEHGIDLTAAIEEGAAADIPMSTMLYTQFSPFFVVTGLAFGVGIAVLASVWPALVASRMPPAEAVRAS